MSIRSKREYKNAIRKRYQKADRASKVKILDECCEVCGYHRKYAIRVLNDTSFKRRRKRPGRPKEYRDPILLEVLTNLWRVLNLPCSKRLKPAIGLWLPHYEKYMDCELTDHIKGQLMAISPATIDRLMSPIRSHYLKLGLSTTKPGSILKSHIPILTGQWDEKRPGYLEADTVAHCGTSMAGSFIFSVNTVDIATGWTEQRAIWGKGYQGMEKALISIENVLPFSIHGFDSDNGSEFLNWHIHKYFRKRPKPVSFTRSRPYKKNDNAHIEEKNWSIIRQYLGYNRFDQSEWTDELDSIYTSEWRLLMNYFRPSSKLASKQRVGARIIKQYNSPKTPYQRLLESDQITTEIKEQLTKQFESLNPFELQKRMEMKIKRFLKKTTPLNAKYSLSESE